jgi:hypothetical protein
LHNHHHHNNNNNNNTTTTNKQGQLRESRMKKLESMGFSWELHMDWESRMQQLRVFKAKYGHCNVPQQIKINGKGRVGTCSLGTWVTM